MIIVGYCLLLRNKFLFETIKYVKSVAFWRKSSLMILNERIINMNDNTKASTHQINLEAESLRKQHHFQRKVHNASADSRHTKQLNIIPGL